MRRRQPFAGPYLDRAAHLREAPGRFDAALADPNSRAVVVWNARNLLVLGALPRAALLDLALLPPQRRNADELILLGRFSGHTCFAVEIESVEPPQLMPGTSFEDLRLIAPQLPAEEAGLLGYARAMISWRRRHRFCGSCGAATLPARSGHMLVCGNASCCAEQFPRIDPAIIVLVSDAGRVLLGRQASWPPGRYSTIAGFVEPGESLEDAVAREVLEETGILIGRAKYYASQPWPFPASLMLGFTAPAVSTAVCRNDSELEDARWFTRAEIAAGAALLPPVQSISFSLIEQWFDASGDRRLRQLHGAQS
ncbi:MAG TPA: NAD(+) diphosphatase [Steroidobacteraceae bacterium]|nr:NAD(+) diphosphatase [Steroidobacteraceae bacterium]